MEAEQKNILSMCRQEIILNAILKEDRAIVTEYEGTTRDTIEEFVNIEGIPLKLIDTAGIRDAKDEVEKIGITKSREIANDADLIIAIFDSSKELTQEDIDILKIIKDKKTIVLLNKVDLNSVLNENDIRFKNVTDHILKISALNGSGLEELYVLISKMFSLNEINLDNDIVITNLRHKNLISKAIENVEKARNTVKDNMPIDIIKVDKVFVDKADLNSNRNIINYIIFIAENLGVKTIVEGVETKEQAEYIKKIKGEIRTG